MTAGSVFCHKEIANGFVLAQDYVADSPSVQLLCINGFDYQIAIDKHMIRERQLVAQSLATLSAFEHWGQTKFDSVSNCFRIKRHQKGEVIISLSLIHI